MAYNPQQPRIPKGMPGAGRFMKVGATLAGAVRDASSPGDGRGRRDRTPFSKAGAALTSPKPQITTRQPSDPNLKPDGALAGSEADIDRQMQERRARQAAARQAQIQQHGDTDFRRGLRAIAEEEAASGEDEIRRLGHELEAKGRTLRTRRNALARIEKELSDLEAGGTASGPKHEYLIDARQAAQQDVEDAESVVAPLQRRIDELRLTEGTHKPRKTALPAAGLTPEQRAHELAGMGSRQEAAAYLANIKGGELEALAGQYNVQHYRTAAERRSAIIERTVGARQNSAILRGGTWDTPQAPDSVAARWRRRPDLEVGTVVGWTDHNDQRRGTGRIVDRNGSSITIEWADSGRREKIALDNKREMDRLHSGTAIQHWAEVTVRESVARHANRGGWAGIAEVRDDLAAAGYSREEQDNALRAMMSQPDVRIVPVADRKNLRPRDRAAALVVGRDDLTAIQVGGDPTVPEVRTQVTVADLRADLAARERQLRLDTEAGAHEDLLTNHRAAIADLRQQIAAAGAERNSPPKPRLAKAAAKLGGPPPASTVESKLRAATSREEARSYLDSLALSKPGLVQMAKDLKVPVRSGATKQAYRDAIVKTLVGTRLDGAAISRNSSGR